MARVARTGAAHLEPPQQRGEERDGYAGGWGQEVHPAHHRAPRALLPRAHCAANPKSPREGEGPPHCTERHAPSRGKKWAARERRSATPSPMGAASSKSGATGGSVGAGSGGPRRKPDPNLARRWRYLPAPAYALMIGGPTATDGAPRARTWATRRGWQSLLTGRRGAGPGFRFPTSVAAFHGVSLTHVPNDRDAAARLKQHREAWATAKEMEEERLHKERAQQANMRAKGDRTSHRVFGREDTPWPHVRALPPRCVAGRGADAALRSRLTTCGSRSRIAPTTVFSSSTRRGAWSTRWALARRASSTASSPTRAACVGTSAPRRVAARGPPPRPHWS